MIDAQATPLRPAQNRAAGRARRAQQAALRQQYFAALAAGFTSQQIAEVHGVNVTTVRRQIDRALDEQRLDAPERYVHLQIARLTKALRVVDVELERGKLAAVGPLMKVVAALDRYHGLKDPKPTHEALPMARLLAAPPLALTHAPALEAGADDSAESADSGA